ncbi:hypothetical protein GJR88_05424 [Dietzia sp. DQ12-45-1b]|nr:hypothetical protein GJR88_05424 [Dietzia sp. DQ12-45-1b]
MSVRGGARIWVGVAGCHSGDLTESVRPPRTTAAPRPRPPGAAQQLPRLLEARRVRGVTPELLCCGGVGEVLEHHQGVGVGMGRAEHRRPASGPIHGRHADDLRNTRHRPVASMGV